MTKAARRCPIPPYWRASMTMVFRLWHYLGIWLAAVMLAVPSAPVSAQRIVAVGDLHGDYDAWIAIARGAGLIDARNRWAGGPATLVQLGDITDRGPDSLRKSHPAMSSLRHKIRPIRQVKYCIPTEEQWSMDKRLLRRA